VKFSLRTLAEEPPAPPLDACSEAVCLSELSGPFCRAARAELELQGRAAFVRLGSHWEELAPGRVSDGGEIDWRALMAREEDAAVRRALAERLAVGEGAAAIEICSPCYGTPTGARAPRPSTR
jgi:hypothetical protein